MILASTSLNLDYLACWELHPKTEDYLDDVICWDKSWPGSQTSTVLLISWEEQIELTTLYSVVSLLFLLDTREQFVKSENQRSRWVKAVTDWKRWAKMLRGWCQICRDRSHKPKQTERMLTFSKKPFCCILCTKVHCLPIYLNYFLSVQSLM